MMTSVGRPARSGMAFMRLARRFAQNPPGRKAQGLIVFLAYEAISLALWGVRLIPHLSSSYLTGTFFGYNDLRFYTWALGWWPNALLHGLNPLHTSVVWAPRGINTTWVTGLPGPALLFAPLTLTAGPLASENVLFLLAPALAAWAAYLLCRQVTRSFWPSVAGGYFFGFSTYMVAEMQAHLNLVLVFPVPLCVYLILRRVDGTLGRSRFVGLLVAALLVQISISLEVFVTMTMLGGLALLAVLALGDRERRGSLLPVIRQSVLAYGIACVLAAPYLIAALPGPPVPFPQRFIRQLSADLFGFFVPRVSTRFGGSAARSTSGRFLTPPPEDGSYLGIPLLLLFGLFAVAHRKRRSTWVLLAMLALPALLALGPALHIQGRPSSALPWKLLTELPGVKNAPPVRVTLYMWLVVAVVVALWLGSARRPRWLGWGLAAVAAAATFPAIYPPSPASVPPFFTRGIYRQYIDPGGVVLPIPSKGDSMAWQAAGQYGFRLATGYVGFLAIPSSERSVPGIWGLIFDRPDRIKPSDLGSYVESHHVQAVVVAPREEARWRQLLGTLGTPPIDTGGVVVYELIAP